MGFKAKDYDNEEDDELEEGEDEAEDVEEELDEEEEEEEDEEEEDDGRSKKRKYKRSQFIDDVAEEDEDEEEEEEVPRKRRHRRASEFIDDTAAVASDEDEEEDEGEEDFIHDEGADLQDEEEARRIHRRPSLLDRDDQNEDVEDLERMIQQRYGRQDHEEYDEAEATEVEQQALLPSIKDPKLWMIKCQLGHEREAAVCLMQKYLNLEGEVQPLLIKSAIALDQLKGYFYIEAEKESNVRQAMKGMRMIYQSMVRLVPIKEMTDVLSVEKKLIDIDKENWVRVKSGTYKGDIAKVLDVDHVKQRATIKLVPRVDLQEVLAKLDGRDAGKKRVGFKPPQRFISIQEVKNMRIPVERKRENSRGDYYDQFANMRFSDGYLIKNASLRSIHTREVVPSLDELQNFHKPGEDENADALGLPSTLASRKRAHFMKGDAVVVVEGDLRNLMGIVEKVDEDNVEVRPKNINLKGNVTFKVKQLTKFFKTGDHVKVISGKHEGSTGMILKVENIAVVILLDTSKEDIRVLKDNIVQSSEITSGLSKLGDFELHDLVALDQTMVGVIVRVEPDGCQILKGTPEKQEVATLKQRDIRKKIFDKNSSSQDREGNVLNLKDIVRVVEGPFKGKQGPIEHIHRGILFICDRHYLENGGFICVKARSSVAVGGTRGGHDHLSMTPLLSNLGGLKSPSHYLQSPSRGTPRDPYLASNGHGQGHGLRRDDGLVGKTVKIRLGPFKGYRGRVKAATDSTVRIELESQMKVVTVRRDQLSDVGETLATYRESPRYGSGSETPMHPSRTPMHPPSYMMTPMRDPSATPIHDGMRTPMRDRAWNPYAGMTPLRDQSVDEAILGSWHNRAATSYQPGTPIAHKAYEAPTPGAGWANTPGGNYSEAGTPNDNISSYGPLSPYIPGTPGGLPMSPAIPAYLPGTPGGQPMTPGTGVLDPTSPVSGMGRHNAEAKWGLPDVVVSIRKPGGESQIGVIKGVLQDGSCRVSLGVGASGDGEILTVSQSDMELVPPKKNDRIKIVFGDMRGVGGKLIGIDGGDGIVKTDDNFDVKILEMDCLGKLAV